MKIIIAGTDRTEEMLRAIETRARTFAPVSKYSPQDSALALRSAANPDEFAERFHVLLRHHRAINTDSLDAPRRPGAIGAVIYMAKQLMWRLLRHQHHRVTGQQNAINELLTAAMDLHRDATRRKIESLEKRISELEAELSRLRPEERR